MMIGMGTKMGMARFSVLGLAILASLLQGSLQAPQNVAQQSPASGVAEEPSQQQPAQGGNGNGIPSSWLRGQSPQQPQSQWNYPNQAWNRPAVPQWGGQQPQYGGYNPVQYAPAAWSQPLQWNPSPPVNSVAQPDSDAAPVADSGVQEMPQQNQPMQAVPYSYQNPNTYPAWPPAQVQPMYNPNQGSWNQNPYQYQTPDNSLISANPAQTLPGLINPNNYQWNQPQVMSQPQPEPEERPSYRGGVEVLPIEDKKELQAWNKLIPQAYNWNRPQFPQQQQYPVQQQWTQPRYSMPQWSVQEQPQNTGSVQQVREEGPNNQYIYTSPCGSQANPWVPNAPQPGIPGLMDYYMKPQQQIPAQPEPQPQQFYPGLQLPSQPQAPQPFEANPCQTPWLPANNRPNYNFGGGCGGPCNSPNMVRPPCTCDGGYLPPNGGGYYPPSNGGWPPQNGGIYPPLYPGSKPPPSDNKPPAAPACPFTLPGWAFINGKDYYLSKPEQSGKMTWFRADALAVQNGGTLAKITSENEASSLNRILAKCYDPGTKFWIGSNELASLGTWEWSSDGSRVGPYTNWDSNEPSGDNEHCMQAVLPGLKWVASNCRVDDGGAVFIAERKTS